MRYRSFGPTGWQVSALGFGCMRLPTLGKPAEIDEPLATRMLRHAIDRGVNYVDTAYPYHGGESERFVGRALRDGYRKKVRLATKMPTWAIRAPEDFDRYLDEQLGKLGTDHLDYYLLHALNRERWPALRELGVFDWAEKAIRSGRIGALGFSFHDACPVFEEIVRGYDRWALAQIQYNYVDVANQAGTRGLRAAAARGVPVVVMEPLLGGKLASAPSSIQAIWSTAAVMRSPVEWALQWLWNQPEVTTVLSGMSAMGQVDENLACAGRSGVGTLSEEEIALFERVRAAYESLLPIPCTQCGYCMPCPHEVGIPRNLSLYNEGAAFGNPESARASYAWLLRAHEAGLFPTDARAIHCVRCGACEPKCPQRIPISEWMPRVHEVLGEGKPYPETRSGDIPPT